MVGRSLQVSPTNLMPQIAKQARVKIISINRDHTAMDELTDVLIKGSGVDILTEIMKGL